MGRLLAIGGKLRRLFDRRPVLVFCGDSHISIPRQAYHAGMFGGRRARFVQVGGATAIGLRHPTSKTQALVRYRKKLLPRSSRIQPVFQIGEVDCGFVIWHRAAKYGETVDAQLEASLGAYAEFLKEIVDAGYRNTIVTSAMLPTIRDGALDGEVARLRSSVTATQRQSTDLTLRHNARLKEIATGLGLAYIDFDPDLLDPDTRLIKDKYRHTNPSDHHLNVANGSALWVRRIKEVVSL